ncbi:hypothetical protein JTB14_007623 [Gonioctena quinquepunctata]|nr:hypothetical protein JTB14_007623 [Gonioctena quinquepunctata]
MDIVGELFPSEIDTWDRSDTIEKAELFTMEKLYLATSKLRLRIAAAPTEVLQLPNGLLTSQWFPAQQRARVVLITKSKLKEMENTSHRSICLLDTLGTPYEVFIRGRLVKDLEENGGSSDNRYGFREGRSTTQAIHWVV